MSDEKIQLQNQIRAMLSAILLDIEPEKNNISVSRAVEWSDVHNKPTNYTPGSHTHEEFTTLISRLSALQQNIDRIQQTCDYVAAKNRVTETQIERLTQIGQDTTKLRHTFLTLQSQLIALTALKNTVQWGIITGVPEQLQDLIPVLSQGQPGQVLMRTSSGYTWEWVQSFVYTLGTTTPTPTFENPILWASGDTDVLLWGSGADDSDYLQWG